MADLDEQGITVGSLVEIFGLAHSIRCKFARFPDVNGDEAVFKNALPEELEGKIGICVNVFQNSPICIVKTFENVIAEVPNECLREFFPPDPQDGGFDLVWPADGALSIGFASAIGSVLAYKGYCMLQMFMNDMDAINAAEKAGENLRQYRMKREVENAYLGLESNTKITVRPHDTPTSKVGDVMSSCDRGLTHIAVALGRLPHSEVGFNVKSRTNAFVRMSYSNELEQEELAPETLSALKDVADWDGDVKGFLNFAETRTVSMLHMIQNSGGRLFLYPRDAAGKSIKLPVSSNKLMLFRHDLLDYSYQPMGRSLALQAWINKDRSGQQSIKEVELDFEAGVATLNPGRLLPEGIPAHVRALHAKMPQQVESEWAWWAEFAAGTDGCSQWPADRWPTEPYYQEGDEAMQMGKSYTKHGGFTTSVQILQFDNQFFGIDDREAKFMMPGQRWSVETGYALLLKSGYNRYTLEGEAMGCWMGDVGGDWHGADNCWPLHFQNNMSSWEATASTHSHITACRLHYIYGMRGPCSSYDTACSASLVAMNAGHTFMMNEVGEESSNVSLVMGWNTLLWPHSFIGNCAAGMLSHVGRSFTFNRAADGYQRGEGSGGVILQRDCTEEQISNRHGVIIGTATNQDGRSASITAPNGPSQTAVIKKSMAFAGINVNTVGMAECHGTGTALGDPIEVGALQAVMRVREEPIYKVSTKSHIGHLEAGAGTAGLTKCLQMIRFSTAPPNCHFNQINPNLVVDGYPVRFTTEASDTGYSSGYCGVSSFGFGGTNSRCDVYNLADKGHRKVVKVQLPKPALPTYAFDAKVLSICGSWTDWAHDTMESEDCVYTYRMTLGEACMERFHIKASGDLCLYPAVEEADQSEQVLGPDEHSNGRVWVIDGREDGMSAGTVYEIRLDLSGGVKCISWTPVAISTQEASSANSMYIAGSFNNAKLQAMQPLRDTPNTYEFQFQIGPRHKDFFQFYLNKSLKQLIYPGASLSVCGPDGSGSREKFSVSGPQFQTATVRLTLRGGQITVTSHTAQQGLRTWGDPNSFSITEEQSYFLVSSADDFKVLQPMATEPLIPGLFKAVITLVHFDGTAASESFQFLMNKDVSKTLFPSSTGAVLGPALDEERRCWTISGNLGDTYEVTLDVKAANRANMVNWNLV